MSNVEVADRPRQLVTPSGRRPPGNSHPLTARLHLLLDSARGPTGAAVLISAGLQLVWLRYLATPGGDMAAQDAWAQFVRQHPSSAYDLAWFGGIHPGSYSVVAPFIMALIGVRTAMVAASILASGVLTRLATRHELPGVAAYSIAIASAGAFLGNAVSGRVTFAVGTFFALTGLSVAVPWSGDRRVSRRQRLLRAVGACTLSACATASSPVAGAFLGIVAAALWIRRQRAQAYWLGLPAVAVVALSTIVFPFSGRQPMSGSSAILPVVMGVAVVLLAPRHWSVLRAGGGVYVVATILAWLVPSPVGSNIVRLGLLFGGVVLLACCAAGRWRTSLLASSAGPAWTRLALTAALVTSVAWQVVLPAKDLAHGESPAVWQSETTQLADELDHVQAGLGRVEVVPTRTHLESALLAAHVPLARGWNRQADVKLNDFFYGDRTLSASTFRGWLDLWAVHYVALSSAEPDAGAASEARLVARGLPYLTKVWSNSAWSLYEVRNPTPLVTPPARVLSFDAATLAIAVPRPGIYQIRIVSSPWLSLVDASGHALPKDQPGGTAPACISSVKSDGIDPTGPMPSTNWVTLHVSEAATYRIGAPYKLPRGSACPS